jgi:hypothetical protein
MLPANRWAFKEWAAICAALDAGEQSLILRKGGIHEGRAGFRVDHDEFWLFPTQFHQEPDQLSPEGAPWLDVSRQQIPPPGQLRLANYVCVEQVLELTAADQLPRLAGLHHWSDETVDQRFHYKHPGLFALVVRVYRLPEPLLIPDSPHFGGCRSWVDLPQALPTNGLTPVLNDSDHATAVQRISLALADVRLA